MKGGTLFQNQFGIPGQYLAHQESAFYCAPSTSSMEDSPAADTSRSPTGAEAVDFSAGASPSTAACFAGVSARSSANNSAWNPTANYGWAGSVSMPTGVFPAYIGQPGMMGAVMPAQDPGASWILPPKQIQEMFQLSRFTQNQQSQSQQQQQSMAGPAGSAMSFTPLAYLNSSSSGPYPIQLADPSALLVQSPTAPGRAHSRRHACWFCKQKHRACSDTRPCTQCQHEGIPCVPPPPAEKQRRRSALVPGETRGNSSPEPQRSPSVDREGQQSSSVEPTTSIGSVVSGSSTEPSSSLLAQIRSNKSFRASKILMRAVGPKNKTSKTSAMHKKPLSRTLPLAAASSSTQALNIPASSASQAPQPPMSVPAMQEEREASAARRTVNCSPVHADNLRLEDIPRPVFLEERNLSIRLDMSQEDLSRLLHNINEIVIEMAAVLESKLSVCQAGDEATGCPMQPLPHPHIPDFLTPDLALEFRDIFDSAEMQRLRSRLPQDVLILGVAMGGSVVWAGPRAQQLCPLFDESTRVGGVVNMLHVYHNRAIDPLMRIYLKNIHRKAGLQFPMLVRKPTDMWALVTTAWSKNRLGLASAAVYVVHILPSQSRDFIQHVARCCEDVPTALEFANA